MASLVERLKRDAICLTAWSEGRGPFPTTVAGVSKVMAERVSQAADRITALEAMCETLAGALEQIATSKYDGLDVHRVSARQCHRIAAQALTQYRAMKEKNDG